MYIHAQWPVFERERRRGKNEEKRHRRAGQLLSCRKSEREKKRACVSKAVGAACSSLSLSALLHSSPVCAGVCLCACSILSEASKRGGGQPKIWLVCERRNRLYFFFSSSFSFLSPCGRVRPSLPHSKAWRRRVILLNCHAQLLLFSSIKE